MNKKNSKAKEALSYQQRIKLPRVSWGKQRKSLEDKVWKHQFEHKANKDIVESGKNKASKYISSVTVRRSMLRLIKKETNKGFALLMEDGTPQEEIKAKYMHQKWRNNV